MEIIYTYSELFENIGLLTLLSYSIYLIIATVEFLIEIYTKKLTFNYLKEISANLSVYIPFRLTEIVTGSLFLIIFTYIATLIPWSLQNNTLSFILCLVFVDFLYYWEHRMEHNIRILWAFHSVHHSSPLFHYSTVLRISFIENFIGFMYFIPAVLVGFDPILIIVCIILMLSYQSWLHNDIIPSLGFIEKLFSTPSLHRVHHGNNTIYNNKNFGAIFSIWDQLFSTYQKELYKPTYGVTKQINTVNPVSINMLEFIKIFKILLTIKKHSAILRYLLQKPGLHDHYKVKNNFSYNKNST
jgi:sterol desaturase/sphingolipid hydroxylase (fatty acid hydroxylase superfamily)